MARKIFIFIAMLFEINIALAQSEESFENIDDVKIIKVGDEFRSITPCAVFAPYGDFDNGSVSVEIWVSEDFCGLRLMLSDLKKEFLDELFDTSKKGGQDKVLIWLCSNYDSNVLRKVYVRNPHIQRDVQSNIVYVDFNVCDLAYENYSYANMDNKSRCQYNLELLSKIKTYSFNINELYLTCVDNSMAYAIRKMATTAISALDNQSNFSDYMRKMRVPTTDDSEDRKINGHAFVDLGLTSGTLWATSDIDDNEEKENFLGLKSEFYEWGDPTGKKITTGDHISENPVGLEDISGTKYDIASVMWNAPWRLPTVEEAQELVNECLWESDESPFGRIFYVKGPSGKVLVFYANGERDASGKVINEQESTTHMTSTANGSTGAYSLFAYKTGEAKISSNWFSDGINVRPVFSR